MTKYTVDSVRTISCETQHDDGEEDLDTANAQDDSWSDHFVELLLDLLWKRFWQDLLGICCLLTTVCCQEGLG